jgi:CheY-like chemotaxis protein
LLVDDEVDLVQVLAEALAVARPDVPVLTAGSFDEALTQLDRSEPDGPAVVVADHGIGGRTGTELLEAVRGRFPATRLMLFTGQASPVAEARARAIGASVLWKPIELKQWIRAVENLLGA